MKIKQPALASVLKQPYTILCGLLRTCTHQVVWLKRLCVKCLRCIPIPWPGRPDNPVGERYKLKDQTCVELRLLGPQDRQRYLNGFKRLSPATNIKRFHTYKAGFSEGELHYLLNIDNKRHLAIGALDCGDPDSGIGLARYIAQPDNPTSAEVAMVVIDEYQGRGLGKLLYQQLIDKARENGITQLHNAVKKDNRAMLHILKQLGAQLVEETDQTYELELYLPPPCDAPTPSVHDSSVPKQHVWQQPNNMPHTPHNRPL